MHGIQIGFARTGPRHAWEGGGVPQNLDRYTDDGGLRILDSPIARFNTSQPRTIDRPSGVVGPSPQMVSAVAGGISTMKIKIGGQTIITFRGKGGKI